MLQLLVTFAERRKLLKWPIRKVATTLTVTLNAVAEVFKSSRSNTESKIQTILCEVRLNQFPRGTSGAEAV